MKLKTPLFTILLILLSSTCFAQVIDQPKVMFRDEIDGLTDDDAVRFALENNDELNALRKEAEASQRLIAQAGQRGRIGVEVGGNQTLGGSSHMYTVKGSVPLELGGRIKSRVTTATREAEVKLRGVEQAEAELASRVRKKFGESLAFVLKLELIEELLASEIERLRLISARVEEGKTAPLEENMMLVEVNRVRAAREGLDSKTRVAILELQSLIGMDISVPLRLKGNFDDSIMSFSVQSELIRRAIATRPDLLILRAMEDVADAKIEMSKSEAKVDASATLGYQRLRMNELMQFNYIVFGIKFMLPSKNQNRDEIASAVVTREAMEKRREFGELVVRQEVAKALVMYESSVRTKEITRVGVVGEAMRNLGVVRQMYELGSISLLEYLAEQRRVIELRQSLIEAELDVYVSRIEIYRASNAPELVTR